MNKQIHTIGLTAIAAVIALAVAVISNDFYLKILFMIGVYYLAGSGMNVLVGWAGQKSLGHAGLFAVGAYTAALLTTRLDWNPWLALICSALVGAVFGVVIALPALRVKGAALAMVTIGFGVVVEKVVMEWQSLFAGQEGISGIKPLAFGEYQFGNQEWVWFVLLLCVATHLIMRSLLNGKYGRAFLAVQTAELAAESIGISVYRYKVLAFVISAVTCSIAGALVAQQNQYINSDFIYFGLSIFLLLIVLFGGSSIYGPLLGAIVLTLLDAFLARWPDLQHFTYGALLLFSLYAMPKGLAGAASALGARLFPRNEEVIPPLTSSRVWKFENPQNKHSEQLLLNARGLYKAYGGVVPTNNVDLQLTSDHVHSLIGPNGAGKTTLLNILSGIVVADKGSISFSGKDCTNTSTNLRCQLGIGRTFQNLKLFGDMTVLENVLTGLHPRLGVGFWNSLLSLPKARREEVQAREEAFDILHFMGLLEWAYQPARSLPYGLQRRLEIARALATHPKLLLLDEPAAGLNPQETHELAKTITKIRDFGITVLLIEHHMDLVMAVSDHVFVLDYGEKIAEGTPAQVKFNPRVIAAYLGEEDVEPAVCDENERLLSGIAKEKAC
jgi:branched-chain amino acid transport system permease protein